MDALEQYIHDHTSPEEELLHELDRETNLRCRRRGGVGLRPVTASQ